MRIGQVLWRQDAVELRFAQELALQHHFAHGFAGLGADFAYQVAVFVADIGVEIGYQTVGVEDVAFADFTVYRDAAHAFVCQGNGGVA